MTSGSGILKTIYENGSYLERENCKVLKFNKNNSSYFKRTTSLF